MNVKNLLSLFVVLQLIVMPVFAVQAAPKDNLTAEEQAELEAKAAESKAQAQETAAEVAEKLGLEFADLQVKLIAGLDKSVEAIDNAIDTINASVYMSSETKVELTDGLKTLQGKLLDYRRQVNNADTMEELQAMNTEVIALLKANKTVIIDAIKESMLVITEQVSQSVEKIKIKAEAALKALDVECDSESFAEIEKLVAELETTNASLKVAIEAEDVATAKTQARAAISLSVNLAASFAVLVDDCEEEIQAQAEINL
ncbi:MAG: hypothetical protein UT30_C0002G0045 [Candidatus Uhrbacteria bacterium GW2011_GWF2_39_13]|uniref:Uncharacterized protein n=1 Tax=Candidatus Uhrbacteria bacterium GW2011_GWF2_39_13 TaxID=1618995 RepID=A0A0G0MP72_9BACT|nr:MAG: hypothetical protein UT30_C0002G0045 [Candidatus Uhrbacteria bacterium GW2011_GWF2_39_13]HAU66133.1 hypothetical protein [Candidatus Uhrbacteria bacterium]